MGIATRLVRSWEDGTIQPDNRQLEASASLLGVLALVVCLKMAVGIALPPSNPLSGAGGHAMLKAEHTAVMVSVRDFVRSSIWH